MVRVEIEWQISFFSFDFARVTEVRHIFHIIYIINIIYYNSLLLLII